MRHADSLLSILILQCPNHLGRLESCGVAVLFFGLDDDLFGCKPFVQSMADGACETEISGRMACAATGMYGTLVGHAETRIPCFERILVELAVVPGISPQMSRERVSPLFAANGFGTDGTGETVVWFHVAFAFIHDGP